MAEPLYIALSQPITTEISIGTDRLIEMNAYGLLRLHCVRKDYS